MSKQSRNYYFCPQKIIRDLVHEYINVTEFELQIIDTIAFQRLKDVRQLTCQQVYPAARHTRFEHSLGVLELTRRAIKHLNQNEIFMNRKDKKKIIDENLEFNACIAALLHDVGHCPYSHLGEREFDKQSVYTELLEEIESNSCLKDSKLKSIIEKDNIKDQVAVHELLSCIIILRTYSTLLSNLDKEPKDDEDGCDLCIDFELIIRSILGITYDVSTKTEFDKNGKKNIIVRLINSKVFDMDKLDYIIRDSAFTGIGMPFIDTKRLFKNMYLDRDYSLVFTSRAVPVLQNMIDARDGLYLYVYNHHAVVFSDFINTYILRRLSHNSRDFLTIIYPKADKDQIIELEDNLIISSLGLVPKPYLFSSGAIIEGGRSDSDWISLLNIINDHYSDPEEYTKETLLSELQSELSQNTWIEAVDFLDKDKVKKLVCKIRDTYKLIHNYKIRNFLKPWWKTVFEFSSFMNQYFQDDVIRSTLGKWICNGGKYGLDADEIRSQIAKHVIYITKHLREYEEDCGLIEPLGEDEFFIIERANRFFEADTIEQLQIALKASEIIGTPRDVNYSTSRYFIKKLTNIIPQKEYSSIYAREGFYVFSKPVQGSISNYKKQKHYKMIEQIFVFVATEFVNRGEQEFLRLFSSDVISDEQSKLQQESMEDMLTAFVKRDGS